MKFEEVLDLKSEKLEVYLGHKKEDLRKEDLSKNNTLIITGSTGTGKSVLLNEILLQLVNKNTPKEIEILPIDQSQVELSSYKKTEYYKNKIYNPTVSQLKEIVSSRIESVYLDNLPYMVIAIDEITSILKEEGSEDDLSWIIANSKRAKVILLLVTSNIYSEFFNKRYNYLLDIKISFDYTSEKDSKNVDLDGCQDLELNEFMISSTNNLRTKTYHTFKFNDSISEKVLNKN